MAKNNMIDVFLREKPVMMMVTLKNTKGEVYASSIAKQIDCTYSHVVKVLQEIERAGLVKFNKQGRLKLLRLTDKGNKLAEHLRDIVNMLAP